uniref:Uncharacterized protein n=1 Tax=Sphenodon punctatus TaxID=8508 RepID=A0A8D0HTK2_SPHPU
MIRLLLCSFLEVIIYQNGTFGNPVYYKDFVSAQQVDFSDRPAGNMQVKRNSYHVSQDADAPNSADHTSLCYFIQESRSQGQISCKLRFTRSKFNFNPFGLRFGKRQQDSGDPASLSSSEVLPSLLKFRLNRMTARCGESGGQDC